MTFAVASKSPWLATVTLMEIFCPFVGVLLLGCNFVKYKSGEVPTITARVA